MMRTTSPLIVEATRSIRSSTTPMTAKRCSSPTPKSSNSIAQGSKKALAAVKLDAR
jgi:hypothetical protein